jgi:peptide/nickel transport system permease protein
MNHEGAKFTKLGYVADNAFTPRLVLRRRASTAVVQVPRRPFTASLWVGAVIIGVVTLIALLAPHLAPYDVAKMMPTQRLQAPSLAHPFGTDLMGRDLFSRVLMGGRISTLVAVLTVTVAAVPGIFAGLLAGMYPGRLERLASRIVDAWIALPGILLAIAMTAAFGRSMLILALAFGLAGIPTYYRQTRAETLRIRGELYVRAARAMGAPEHHILLRHIIPNILPPLVVVLSLRVGGMLVAVSSLSFIGLGAQPPDPEWGALLADGRDYFE